MVRRDGKAGWRFDSGIHGQLREDAIYILMVQGRTSATNVVAGGKAEREGREAMATRGGRGGRHQRRRRRRGGEGGDGGLGAMGIGQRQLEMGSGRMVNSGRAKPRPVVHRPSAYAREARS
jgi:hypothetical protein